MSFYGYSKWKRIWIQILISIKLGSSTSTRWVSGCLTQQPTKRPFIKMIWTAAIAVAASVAVLLVLNIDFSSPHYSQPSQADNELQAVDQAFAQLSSADQAYLLNVYQEDVFLDD